MRGIQARLFAAASLALVAGMSAHGKHSEPFAYKFVMTPEEGPLDRGVERRYTAAFDECQKRAVSTVDHEACFAAEINRQDKVLNRTWRLALANIPPQMHQRLFLAQRSWIAQRNPFCKMQANEFRGGTIMPVIYADCRVEQTIRRTIWLEKLR